MNAKVISVASYLPLFSGFYNTIFEADESSVIERINNIREENKLAPLNSDDLSFDYPLYNDTVAKNCVLFVQDIMKAFGVVSIEFEEVVSPRQYNFGNDSINVKYIVDCEALFDYVKKHEPQFSKYLKENYTSYEGFIPSHSNNFNDWIEETENFTIFEDGHKLGSILEFICRNEEIVDYDMLEEVTIEVPLKNEEFECNKVLCDKCGEWFTPGEFACGETPYYIYKKILKIDLENAKKAGIINPEIKSFENWRIQNPELKSFCGFCEL
jgi:hypothetical protein